MKGTIKIVEANLVGAEEFCDDEFSTVASLGECTDKMSAWLKEKGLFINGKLLHFDTETLDEIDEVTEKIINELDMDDKPTWDRFGLRMDDDVDFCGSYIETVTEVIRTWLDWKGNKHESA